MKNRDAVIEEYVNRMVDGMDVDMLAEFAIEALTDRLNAYTDEIEMVAYHNGWNDARKQYVDGTGNKQSFTKCAECHTELVQEIDMFTTNDGRIVCPSCAEFKVNCMKKEIKDSVNRIIGYLEINSDGVQRLYDSGNTYLGKYVPNDGADGRTYNSVNGYIGPGNLVMTLLTK